MCFAIVVARDAFISRGVIARSCSWLRKTHCALNFLQVTCCCMHVMWRRAARSRNLECIVWGNLLHLRKKPANGTDCINSCFAGARADNELVYLFESSIECGTTKFSCKKTQAGSLCRAQLCHVMLKNHLQLQLQVSALETQYWRFACWRNVYKKNCY